MTRKVLIVGGGIGGQTTAIALKNAGFEVEIAEIQKEFNVYGVGIIQQANALRALDAIGVADEALKRGYPYGLVKLCTPTGHQVAEVGTPNIGRFPNHNGISRRTLHDILYEKTKELNIPYRMGVTVESLDEQADQVHVTFTDGSKDNYDVVVGSDGIRSKVRKLLFGQMPLNYVGLSVWRYPFPRPADMETGYMYMGRKSKIGLIPMSEKEIYMFVVSAEGADNPSIKEEDLVPKLQSYLKDFPLERIQNLISQITDPKLVNYRPMETVQLPAPWYKGRVIIIGDAAHATIPQLGSGAALAIEDGVVLAELLQKDDSIEHIFEEFMIRRLDRCMMVVDASETLGKWELMEFEGQHLPEGANAGALMGKTCFALTKEI